MNEKLLTKLQIAGIEDQITLLRFTKADIEAYVREILDFAEVVFAGSDYKMKRITAAKEKLNITYRDQRAGVIATAYCLLSSETFGRLELNVGFVRSYLTTVTCAEMQNTIVHEICHFIAGAENGHNHVWRNACFDLSSRLRNEGIYFGSDHFRAKAENSVYGFMVRAKFPVNAKIETTFGGLFINAGVLSTQNQSTEEEDLDDGIIFHENYYHGFGYEEYNELIKIAAGYYKEVLGVDIMKQ